MQQLNYILTKAMSYVQGAVATALYVKAAAGAPIKVLGWGVAFNGVTADEALILCELCTGTCATNGTAAGDITPAKLNTERSVALSPALAKYGPFSVEPTALSPVQQRYVVTKAGAFKELFGENEVLLIQGGSAVGIRIATPAAMVTLTGLPWLLCEE